MSDQTGNLAAPNESPARTSGHAWRDGRCVHCDVESGRPWAEPCPEVRTATHGNVTTHHGTCQTCGLEDVDLKVNWDRRRDEPHYTCVDEFACYAAWEAQR